MFIKHLEENLKEAIIDQIKSNTHCFICSKKLETEVKVIIAEDKFEIETQVYPCHDCTTYKK